MSEERQAAPRGSSDNQSEVISIERYQKLLSVLPIGVYETLRQDEQGLGRDVLVECNENFAQLLGYNRPSDLIGKELGPLFGGDQYYNDLLEKLINHGQSGKPLLAYTLPTHTPDGRPITLEVNCLIQTRENKVNIFGAVRDVTEEERLKRAGDTISVFIADIGAVLHTYSSLLVMISTSIEPLQKALNRQIAGIDDASSQDEIEALIDTLASRINAILAQVLNYLTERDFSPQAAAYVNHQVSRLTNYKSIANISQLRAPILREMAADMLDVIDNAPRGLLPRELARALKTAAWELERACCLVALRRVQDSVRDTDYQIRAFRDFAANDVRPYEQFAERSAAELVKKAINNVAELAHIRHIDIRLEGNTKAVVRVTERAIVRCLSNLLHNAIKYSWNRTDGLSWIVIRCRCEMKCVRLEIENYGVAIPQDEIESGSIFRIGVRGRLANDRGRIGTGIGLADAKGAAEGNGGFLSIESRPASHDNLVDYSKPFITKAVLTLPWGGKYK